MFKKITLQELVEQGGIRLSEQHTEDLFELNEVNRRLVSYLSRRYQVDLPNLPIEWLNMTDYHEYAANFRFMGIQDPLDVDQLAGMYDKDKKVIKVNSFRSLKQNSKVLAHEIGHAVLYANDFNGTTNSLGFGLRKEGEYHEVIAMTFEYDALPHLYKLGKIGIIDFIRGNIFRFFSFRNRRLQKLQAEEGITMKEIIENPQMICRENKRYFRESLFFYET